MARLSGHSLGRGKTQSKYTSDFMEILKKQSNLQQEQEQAQRANESSYPLPTQNGISFASSPSNVSTSPTPTSSPTPAPVESGIRNTVDPSAGIIDNIKLAITQGDKKALRSNVNRFFQQSPTYAARIPYNDQYDLIIMDGQALVMGQGIEKSFDDPVNALQYADEQSLSPQPGPPRPEYTYEPTPVEALHYELGDLRNEHLGFVTKAKSILSPDKVVNQILAHEETIDNVSTELGVPKEIIQAVLFREQICLGLEDAAADLYVNSIEPIAGGKNDSSTGLGQIFAKTAITAEREVNENYDLDPDNDDDVAAMWTKLYNDDKTNIYYVGLVLQMEADRQKIDLKTADSTQIANVLAAYNGGYGNYTSDAAQRYGTETKQYYDLFVQYNSQK